LKAQTVQIRGQPEQEAVAETLQAAVANDVLQHIGDPKQLQIFQLRGRLRLDALVVNVVFEIYRLQSDHPLRETHVLTLVIILRLLLRPHSQSYNCQHPHYYQENTHPGYCALPVSVPIIQPNITPHITHYISYMFKLKSLKLINTF